MLKLRRMLHPRVSEHLIVKVLLFRYTQCLTVITKHDYITIHHNCSSQGEGCEACEVCEYKSREAYWKCQYKGKEEFKHETLNEQVEIFVSISCSCGIPFREPALSFLLEN